MPAVSVSDECRKITVMKYLVCSEPVCTLVNYQLADQVSFFALNTGQNLFPGFAGVFGEPHFAPVGERSRFLECGVSMSTAAASGQKHTYRPNFEIRCSKCLEDTFD